MKESQLLRFVLDYARERGWLAAHFGSSVKYVRRGDSYQVIPDKDATGFPDVVLCRGTVFLVRELKGEKGKVRPEQAVWVAALREAGVDAGFWFPGDLSLIQETLR